MNRPSPRGADGYIATLVVLLIVPLVLIAGLVVDVGGWYLQARDMQNAADAAALAAAGYLPRSADARAAGYELAGDNGYVAGVDRTRVVTTVVSPTEVRVEIARPAKRYLAAELLGLNFTIGRSATAKSLPPLNFESPDNYIGFGPYSIEGIAPRNYWLYENNDCQKLGHGDVRATRYIDTPDCLGGTVVNPWWKNAGRGRDQGYFYNVTIPPGLSVGSDLYVLDPGACPEQGEKKTDELDPDPDNTTTLQFYQWSDGASPGPQDDSRVAGPWQSTKCFYDGWVRTPFSFPPNRTGEPEHHFVQTIATGYKSARNTYSLLVVARRGRIGCTSFNDPTCPTIAAEGWIPVAPNIGTDPVALHLTRVSSDYAGKHLVVEAYDLGEGMESVHFEDPNGKPLTFTWSTDDGAYGQDQPPDSCSGHPCLYLYPERRDFPAPYPYDGWEPRWKFNGRIITFDIPIDNQFEFSSYAHDWVTLIYTPSDQGNTGDLASFRISVDGSPTRLVE